MNDLNLDRLERLEADATSGPWVADPPSAYGTDDDGYQMQSSLRAQDSGSITWDDHGGEVFKPADAEFIADMRNTTPALLARIRELEAERDAAVAAIERVRDALKAERAWHEHLVESGEAAPRNAIGIGVVEKALDGAPEPEDVWEYGYELIEPNDRNVFEREGDFISSVIAYCRLGTSGCRSSPPQGWPVGDGRGREQAMSRYEDDYGRLMGYCNDCGEETPIDDECCDSGEVVHYDDCECEACDD